MVLPLALAAPLIPAGIATLGAAARGISSPFGQSVIRQGSNLFNRGISALSQSTMGQIPQYLQSLSTGSRFVPNQSGFFGNVVMPSLGSQYLMDPSLVKEEVKEGKELIDFFADIINEKVEEEEKEEKKDKKKKKKKEDEIPEVALKKGGMAKSKKPKRKRKKYKPGTFVKMKGRKRYI